MVGNVVSYVMIFELHGAAEVFRMVGGGSERIGTVCRQLAGPLRLFGQHVGGKLCVLPNHGSANHSGNEPTARLLQRFACADIAADSGKCGFGFAVQPIHGGRCCLVKEILVFWKGVGHNV